MGKDFEKKMRAPDLRVDLNLTQYYLNNIGGRSSTCLINILFFMEEISNECKKEYYEMKLVSKALIELITAGFNWYNLLCDYFTQILDSINQTENICNFLLIRDYIDSNTLDAYDILIKNIARVVHSCLKLVDFKNIFDNLIKKGSFCRNIRKAGRSFTQITITKRMKLFDLFFKHTFYRLIDASVNWLQKYAVNAQQKYENNQNAIRIYKTKNIIEDLTNKEKLKFYLKCIKMSYAEKNGLSHNGLTHILWIRYSDETMNKIKSKINELDLYKLRDHLNNDFNNIIQYIEEYENEPPIFL